MFGLKLMFLFCVVVFALLNGCAEAPKKVEAKPSPRRVENVNRTINFVPMEIGTMLAQASADSQSGWNGKAVNLLKSATKTYPADKRPWLQMAQINFNNTNYGDAITNALEALQRDPSDEVANSIVAVSGLRLSTSALTDLRKQKKLFGSIDSEAQDLARLLRESLGELVLVPASTSSKKNYSAYSSANKTHRAVPKKISPVVSSMPAMEQAPKADVDPFSSLE